MYVEMELFVGNVNDKVSWEHISLQSSNCNHLYLGCLISLSSFNCCDGESHKYSN